MRVHAQIFRIGFLISSRVATVFWNAFFLGGWCLQLGLNLGSLNLTHIQYNCFSPSSEEIKITSLSRASFRYFVTGRLLLKTL